MHLVLPIRQIDRAPHILNLLYGNALVQKLCNADDALLAHPVGRKVRSGIHQNTAAHLIAPIIVMGKTPQGRFQAPDDDGNIAIGLPDSVAVDNHRPVGALAHHASRRIVVVGPFLQ